MSRPIIVLLIALVLTGCNLTTQSVDNATETPPPTRTTSFTTATETSVVPVSSPLPATLASTVLPTVSSTTIAEDCEPQAEWIEYEVQPGDNLTRIARRTRSTVDELKAANCMDDAEANRIRVGQSIYVPNEPEN